MALKHASRCLELGSRLPQLTHRRSAAACGAALVAQSPSHLRHRVRSAGPGGQPRHFSVDAIGGGAYHLRIGEGCPFVVNCIIEISKESRMKYEWDEEVNMLRLDRVLSTSMFYPHNYGFIPQTLCGDGDPLDVLVMGNAPLLPGCVLDVRAVGHLIMTDEKGEDEKVLAVPNVDPRFNDVKDLGDVSLHQKHEIEHFFHKYKDLEKDKWVEIGKWKDVEETRELIRNSHKLFLDSVQE